MKTIVFTAQPFAFGPVSKMLTISESITNFRKIFFGTGTAYDLAKLHTFDEMYRLDGTNSQEIIALLQKADLFVNVMDFPISRLAKSVGCPYFIVDVLLWFWPEKPEGIEKADIYFCQDFFGTVESKIQEYRLTNAQMVSPIVSKQFQRLEKSDQAIISFGGMECEFIEIGKNSSYPFIVLKNLLPVLKENFQSILVVGRERVLQMCRKQFPETDHLHFEMLSRKRFLEELWRSAALFTAPGSETIFDAYDKLPIFCLPPQNNSNARNLELFIAHKAIKHYFSWNEIYDLKLNWQETNQDGEEIQMVLSVIKKFESSESAQKRLRGKVENFIRAKNTWHELVLEQKKAIERFGVSGTEAIVQAIHSFASVSR